MITMGEALAGFSDPNIVLIAALFVIGDGLVRTGVARHLGDWLTAKAGGSEVKLLVLLMIVVCGLGATMSSTAVTAIFIPVVLRISQSVGTSPSRLMMPLSFAALISGMTTLIATAPNLVVNSELVRHLKEQGQVDATGFHFFSFTPFGVPILILGIVYMLFARRWLRLGSKGQRQRRTSAEPARLDRRIQTCGARTSGSCDGGLAAGGKDARGIAASRYVGRHVGRDRARRQADSAELEHGSTRRDILFVDLSATEAEVAALREQYALERAAAERRVFHRSVARNRHGRGDRAGDLGSDRQDTG